VADPARQIIDFFVSERLTVRQGFAAVSLAAATSLIAGLTLAGMHSRLEAVEGLFILIPVSIGMRGNIFGALAARLGTSIHSGMFETSREGGGLLAQNVYAAAMLTVATSVTMGLLGRAIAALLGIRTVSVWDFVVITVVGGILSSAVVLAVTVYLSLVSFRRGWDLDSVGAPLITAIGDVVTLPCLVLATFLVGIRLVTPSLGALAAVAGGLALWRGVSAGGAIAQRIVRESFPILCVAIILDLLAGAVVQPRTETVFARFPALLIVLPGFLEITGALGGILAARLGSKLHLGVVSPRARPDAVALLDGSIIFLLGATVYTLISTATLGLAEVFNRDYPGVLRFLGLVISGGLLSTLVATLIGYYAATATYRFGLDPDNQTIPVVTSGMDLLGVICLVLALVVFGVA
jgi:mgtE-like transporter